MRDCKPSLVDKQFQEVSKITRTEARAKRLKNNQVSKIKLPTSYNPSLSKRDETIRKFILFYPSKYPNPKSSRQSSITSCNKCDICKPYMVFYRTFKYIFTGKVHYIKDEMNCESTNIIYSITCMKCLEQ